MGRILVYTTSGCSHCVRAKRIFETKGTPFTETNLAFEPHKKDEMVTATGGKKTVPQIFFNHEYIGVRLLSPLFKRVSLTHLFSLALALVFMSR